MKANEENDMTEHAEPLLGRPAKYDWAALADGEEHTLEEGVDFSCTAESFAILVRRTARVKRRSVKVHRLSGNRIQFTFGPEAIDADSPQAG
jgi:hypothetical protein